MKDRPANVLGLVRCVQSYPLRAGSLLGSLRLFTKFR